MRIGSAVARALSEIYLRFSDLKLHDMIKDSDPGSVFSKIYVGGISVCIPWIQL